MLWFNFLRPVQYFSNWFIFFQTGLNFSNWVKFTFLYMYLTRLTEGNDFLLELSGQVRKSRVRENRSYLTRPLLSSYHFIQRAAWDYSCRKGAYFKVFSCSFCFLLSIHRQLISISITSLLSLSTNLASTLLALTCTCSAKTGTSQYAVALSSWYIGLGWTGEYQGGMAELKVYFQLREHLRDLV